MASSPSTCNKPNRKAIIVAVIGVYCLVHVFVLVPRQQLHQFYDNWTAPITVRDIIDDKGNNNNIGQMIPSVNAVPSINQSHHNKARDEVVTGKTTASSSRASLSGLLDLFWKVDDESKATSAAVERPQHGIIDSSAYASIAHDNRTATSIPQPYSQRSITRLVHDSLQRLQLFIFHPDVQKFQVYSLSKNPTEATHCVCKEHIVELIIEALRTTNNFTTITHPIDDGGNHSLLLYHEKPLQIVFDTLNDHVYYPCMDNPNSELSCHQKHYAPILTIGSVPTNPAEAPFLLQLPSKHYNNCLYRYRQNQVPRNNRKTGKAAKRNPCTLRQLKTFATSLTVDVWNSLLPQIFWRGSSLDFLVGRRRFRDLLKCHELALAAVRKNPSTFKNVVADFVLQHAERLTPRCYAVAMTIKAESDWSNVISNTTKKYLVINQYEFNRTNSSQHHMPWINAKYTRNKYHTDVYGIASKLFLDNYTSPAEMAKYKYQIDFGGMGGTTWLGTITKLAMPGLLFHHDTPTKDWFYDEIQPWVHYVPIHTNLSNLYDMFVWAETHPNEAKQIARKGQEYALHHVSAEHYQTTFEKLFVPRVQQVATAYRPQPGEKVASILEEYRANNVSATLIGTCDEASCDFSFS